ncbi:septation protein SepH [Rothia uropygialis]|uniref:septation protein SepH n=1 Tax=Kocuria sp. 36 TaxID=1415402 RepID=UPI00101D886D|nr:septation protein SepH [Kocuria sp. 36]
MDRLTFVGVQDDGEHLVLESADGEQRYQVRIDNGLRNAVVKARRAQAPRGLSGRGDYGPRDIQTRFRQGATVDEIVAESGWKPERVRRYEWPILAERAHIVTAARNVVVRSLDPRSRGRKTLNDQVVAVREDWNFAEGDAQWNSWQREDGQWNVTVSVNYSQPALAQIPSGADFPARFVYNPANQTVVAGNAVAEFLFGQPHEDAEDLVSATNEGLAEACSPGGSAEDSTLPSDSADAGTGSEAVSSADQDESDASGAPAPEEAGHQASAPSRKHLRAVAADEPTATETLLDELEARRGTASGSDPNSDQHITGLTEKFPEPDTDADEDNASSTAKHDAATDSDQRGNRSRGGRPSVPSWDDIVFGQHRPKD